jgi:hypothetical protein
VFTCFSVLAILKEHGKRLEMLPHQNQPRALHTVSLAVTARRLLVRKPSAKVVVVVPTVHLVRQQCIMFEKAGFRGVTVGSTQSGASNGNQQQGFNHRWGITTSGHRDRRVFR